MTTIMDLRELEIAIREDLFLKFFEYATRHSSKDVKTCFDASNEAVNNLLNGNTLQVTLNKMSKTLEVE